MTHSGTYGGAEVDGLIDRANADVAAGRMPAIIAAPAALLDPLAARIDALDAQLLIDANETERAAALAIATAWRGTGATLVTHRFPIGEWVAVTWNWPRNQEATRSDRG